MLVTVSCDSPEIDNGGFSGSETCDGTVTFECDDGYELNGADTLTCQVSGTWSGALPTCDPGLSFLFAV